MKILRAVLAAPFAFIGAVSLLIAYRIMTIGKPSTGIDFGTLMQKMEEMQNGRIQE